MGLSCLSMGLFSAFSLMAFAKCSSCCHNVPGNRVSTEFCQQGFGCDTMLSLILRHIYGSTTLSRLRRDMHIASIEHLNTLRLKNMVTLTTLILCSMHMKGRGHVVDSGRISLF